MRKLLLLITGAFSCSVLTAQLTETDITRTRQLVSKNTKEIGLSTEDLSNYKISSSYLSTDGFRMVYLYQSYRNIPVYNQMHVLAFKGEKVVSVAGGRIAGIERLVNNPTGTPSLAPGQAVLAAIANSDIPMEKINGSVSAPAINSFGKLDFGKLGVALENITAELFWYPAGEKKYNLVWQVFVAPEGKADMWSIKVDAASGAILGKDNFTVYCNWHRDDQSAVTCDKTAHALTMSESGMNKNKIPVGPYLPATPVVNSATYRVVKFPAESPLHPGGTPSLHTDPWLLAPGNATTLKWHNDGSFDHDSTRGNNAWAAEDRNNTNTVMDKAALSLTPQPSLSFDYTPNFAAIPTIPENQPFNITNVFYMNNIIHDLVYQYGFNEVSGNFQNTNLGRGGAGNDYVIVDAQDGGGTNNANFGAAEDGTRPRMQMYIWTAANPDRDGDADNGVITHEFGHGISLRLTGGPANSSCLGNAEQAGEGWSDYYALMANTNWATATVSDGPLPRTIGTYADGQSPSGPGIRNFPYSTNLAVNPLVYSASISTQPHNRGEYWCAALWEMTWGMIQQSGINPNIFNAAGVGGNSASLKLVTEGMKLQPCSPGFIDARDAILKADTLFFGAQYSCAIWTAFAKRGMGRGASQGSSNSVTDQVPSFIANSGDTKITENVTSQVEGANVTYTNSVTAQGCGAISNYYVTDTLPTNVTYVSGGSYNAGNRTVTFSPVNLAAGATQSFPFTVSINAGSYFAPVTHLNETVPGATIPASWTSTSINATQWTVSTTVSHSAPNSFAALYNAAMPNDFRIATTSQITLTPNTASNYTTLNFWHRFNTEDGWDGGVVEISTNNGSSWSDLGPYFIKNKYNSGLGTGSNNPIGGRSAFSGTSAGFIESTINLSSFAGQSILIRFRFASDDNTGAPTGTGGWWVDDIVIYSEPAIQMRSNLFNAANLRQSFADTLTRITAGCAAVTVTSQPANANGCIAGSTTFSVTVNGTTPTYQWQVNTGSGFNNLSNDATYSGVLTPTLTVSNITAGMNGYLYRVVVGGGCTSSFNSNSATLSVGSVATINTHPTSVSVCPGVNVNFSVGVTNPSTYQWQVNTGTGFTDITNNPPYTGAQTATLTITNVTAGMNNYQYRCIVGSCPSSLTSNAATLQVSTPLSITVQPANITACEGDNVTFSLTITGTVTSYQWSLSTDGVNYNPISGATSATYSLTNVTTSLSGNRYRVFITGPCGNVTSSSSLLTVNPLPGFTIGTLPVTVCNSDPAITLTASVPGGVWSGSGVSGSTFTPSLANVGNNVITYTVTALGCSKSLSATIQVNQCSVRHLLLSHPEAVRIYPNPNSGVFSLEMMTDLYKNLGVKVFDSHGRLVRSFFFGTVSFGTIIPMRLTTLEDGVYHLYLYNQENGFISGGTSFVIQH